MADRGRHAVDSWMDAMRGRIQADREFGVTHRQMRTVGGALSPAHERGRARDERGGVKREASKSEPRGVPIGTDPFQLERISSDSTRKKA